MAEYRLEMRDVYKSFPGVKAWAGAQLRLRPGTVHALMGENGAGKSTLMKCMFGIYRMDSGQIYYEGRPVTIRDPLQALRLGIAMVHQELQPIPARSVAENIFVGRYPLRGLGPLKLVDHRRMYRETARLLEEVGMPFDPKAKLGELSVSQMQSVEIAKAVYARCRVLILDEPTSSLTAREAEALFQIIAKLKAQGVSIVYISHKMEEILRISDEVTIMRDGCYVGTWPAKELTTGQIITRMVGRELASLYPPLDPPGGEPVLKVQGFTSPNPHSFRDVDFALHRGEILGVGGLVGAQRTELMEALFGIRAHSRGQVFCHGRPVQIRRPGDAIRQGMALLTEDRRATGILGVLPISDNIAISSLDRYLRWGCLLDQRRIQALVEENFRRLSIKAPSGRTPIQALSGGNQQKVLFSRWLATDPDILILDEPTRGIDVGAKHEIYAIIARLARQGKGVLLISSELGELIGMSHRVMVMCDGRVTGFLEGEAVTQEGIMALATQFS